MSLFTLKECFYRYIYIRIDGETMKTISVYLDDRTKSLTDEYAEQKSLSRSSAIRLILRTFLKKEGIQNENPKTD